MTDKIPAYSTTGVIGGSGFYSLDGKDAGDGIEVLTPFNDQPVFLYQAHSAGGNPAWFIPRHGVDHSVPPHRINYRANIWALREAGVERVIAVNMTGGISQAMAPGTLVIPDQLIDYSWGREHTFFGGLSNLDNHVDFTLPYNEGLSRQLVEGARLHDIPVITGAVYACTQGPRLETAAEIRRLKRDGCDIVGMTGMPEAALAREAGLDYACIALVVNWGAGLVDGPITMDGIQQVMDAGIGDIRTILTSVLDTQ